MAAADVEESILDLVFPEGTRLRERYLEMFIEEELNYVEVLVGLQREDLTDLNIRRVDQTKILAQIKRTLKNFDGDTTSSESENQFFVNIINNRIENAVERALSERGSVISGVSVALAQPNVNISEGTVTSGSCFTNMVVVQDCNKVFSFLSHECSLSIIRKVFGLKSNSFHLLAVLQNFEGEIAVYPQEGTFNCQTGQFYVIKSSDAPLDLFYNFQQPIISILNLYGGAPCRSGGYRYQAPNGTIVQCSLPVYDNQEYYHLEYLFTGDVTSADHHHYWLSAKKAKGKLQFKFPEPIDITEIHMYATCHRQDPRSCNYQIYVCEDVGEVGNMRPISQIEDTLNDSFGSQRVHVVNAKIQCVRIDLFCNGANYMGLREIDFFHRV